MSSNRLAQFQAYKNPNGSNGRQSQAQRRQDALDRQREERKQAFSLTRTGFEKIADALDFSSEEEDDTTHVEDIDAPEVQGDLSEDTDEHGMQVEASTSAVKTDNKPKAIKKKWRAYANRLMQGEALDYSEGLPSDLAEEWLAVSPVPQGKRCMAVTFSITRKGKKGRATNTLLLARQSGRPLSRHLVPALPPDCVLDCIYSESLATLFVLDLLRWKSQSMTESEAEFRMFWRDSKLSELGPQPLPPIPSALPPEEPQLTPPKRSTKPMQLVAVPIPCLSTPLSQQVILEEIVKPSIQNGSVQFSYQAIVQQDEMGRNVVQPVTMQYAVEGVLLLVKSASYESGSTPLAAWIPKEELPQFGQALLSAASNQ